MTVNDLIIELNKFNKNAKLIFDNSNDDLKAVFSWGNYMAADGDNPLKEDAELVTLELIKKNNTPNTIEKLV